MIVFSKVTKKLNINRNFCQQVIVSTQKKQPAIHLAVFPSAARLPRVGLVFNSFERENRRDFSVCPERLMSRVCDDVTTGKKA